ncbi:MAG: histidinol-phosphate aminotransferase family protein [Bacteroidaceae bacterium]|nr:histidinol-phosphate aminotransferase family protein [Bacteroidaceae bacterium]
MNFLDRNEFNFQPSQEVINTIHNFDIGKFCFYTRIYDQGKKSIFSEYLAGMFDIEEKRILLGYGAEDILKNAVHYFLTKGPNNKMLIPKFSWWYYKSIADEVDGQTLQYPVYETEDSFCYDMEGLKKMIEDEKPRILLVASPNNPTGNGLTPDELDHIINMTSGDTIVLIDEAYAAFLSSDITYVKHLVDAHPNVIISRTLSKFYGLPGLRLGFGFISQSEEMEKFARFSNKYLGYDRLSEEVGIAALKSENHYRQIANVMDEARKMYTEELGSLPGFKVYKSVANFILIKYPIEKKEALQVAFAGEDYKVKFMNEPALNQQMRITLGRKEQNRKVCDIILSICKQ